MSKIYSFNNSLVQAGNNLLAGEPGGTGPTYIPGQYISIEDDVISVTGLQPEGDYATEAELQTVSAAIPDVSNLATEADLQIVSAAIPDVSNLASKSEVQAVADDVQIVSAAIPDVSNLATESDLQTVSAAIPAAQVQSNWNETNSSSKAYIQNKPTTLAPFNTAGITDIQYVNALPANPVSSVLYIIPET